MTIAELSFAVLVLAIMTVTACWAALGGYMPGAGAGAANPALGRRSGGPDFRC